MQNLMDTKWTNYKISEIRMHSSRMRTVRSSGRILGRGGGGGVCSGGSAPRGVSAPSGCLCSGGVSALGGCLLLGGVVSQHALRQTPPPTPHPLWTDRCL